MSYRARSTRFQTEKLPVTLRILGSFAWSKGVLLNLSAGGAQIYSQAKFASDTDVEIEFTTINTVGKTTKSRMIARVVWYSGYRYGLQFRKKTTKRP